MAGINDSVMHLLPTCRSGKLDERETLGQLADHLRVIAYLMTPPSAEVASIDATGDLEAVVRSTARMGETFGSAGATFGGLGLRASWQGLFRLVGEELPV